MKKDLVSGFLDLDDVINFRLLDNSYTYAFMNKGTYNQLSPSYKGGIPIPINNGFIFGHTHDDKSVAISAGNFSFILNGYQELNAHSYLLFNQFIEHPDTLSFKTIEFIGGSLNSLFKCNSIDSTDLLLEKKLSLSDDSHTYSITSESGSFTICIKSLIQESYSPSSSKIENSDVSLQITFEEQQPLALDQILSHYEKIKKLISFMTYRTNIGFDRIIVRDFSDESQFPVTASFHFDEADTFDKTEYFYNITFEDLGCNIVNLLSEIYSSDNKHFPFLGDILPYSKKDICYMNADKLRSICSALESEMNIREELYCEKNENLNSLIKQVKSTIKSFRKNNNNIDDKTYSLIYGSIKHWSLSLSEKISILYSHYKNEMNNFVNVDFEITNENISEFVKVRNNMTHNGFFKIDRNTAATSILLTGLIYCSILDRIGISSDQICELCNHKIIS